MHKAIVTGGTSGIGLAIARDLAKAGGSVVITGRTQARVDAALRELSGAGGRIVGKAVDVRKRTDVDALVAETAKAFGGLDVLINNAGVGAFADVAAMTDETWHQIIDTNLTGVFYCTRAAIPPMRQSGGGWIINVASLAGRNYFPGGAAYCASKAGLIAFTEALMQEVRYDNIRVSVIMPGSVTTEFNGHVPGADDAWKLAPEDVSELVVDLLRHPSRSLPSKIEIRPSKPKK
jgi:NAD(P)-dependent dehydrogenase (short-subunit alcohol dehydrogenase family)